MAYYPLTNFWIRTLTSLVLMPLCVVILMGMKIWQGVILAIFLTLCMIHEWIRMRPGILWGSLGNVYIVGGVSGWCVLYHCYGSACLVGVLALIWATDVGAYVTGRTLGGPKLAPRISPNKTWAGFYGGLLCVLSTAHIPLIRDFLGELRAWWMVIVIGLVAHMGDLIESWAKRMMGAKDSGNLIPGHGGLLDRLDSFLGVGWVLGVWTLVRC
jgi:phosphatidate cytidylyltransferase